MKRPMMFLVLLAVLSLSLTLPLAAQEEVYFPTTEWRTSTPEEQGMNSDELAEFFQTFSQEQFNLDSLLVIRNGYIVAETYSPPNQPEALHHMYSASKNVVSALVGIAIDQGYIKSVDEKLLGFFPEYAPANMDERKAAITVKDLLTMGSGFQCDLFGADPSTDAIETMKVAESTSQFCLNLPMAYQPGEKQQYCQCNTYLLASILSRTTGMDVLEFAKKNLFEPLGITEAGWLTMPEGVIEGFSGLQLKPRDMAKFGYLFLNQGQWNGKQIISAQYVVDSMSNQIVTAWPDLVYGYQWWMQPSVNTACALGHGGQYIVLNPAKNLMVVLTGGIHDMLRLMIHAYPFLYGVAGFSTADAPLPANPEGMRQLDAVIEAISNPQPQSVGPMPDIESTISDQPFALLSPMKLIGFGDTQGTQVQMVNFQFDGSNQAMLNLIPVEGQPKDITIGLDGLYRVSDFWGGQVATRGQWLTDHDFRLYMRYTGDALTERLDFSFMPGAVTIVTFENSTGLAAGYAGTAVQPE